VNWTVTGFKWTTLKTNRDPGWGGDDTTSVTVHGIKK
jgi:hypothetical protein